MASTLEAIHVSNPVLPIIEMGGLSSSSVTDRKAVSERLRAVKPAATIVRSSITACRACLRRLP
jgi:hypothetical protein